jgi:hypothetical protein
MSSTVFLTLSKFDLDAWMQLDRPDERARIAASGDTVFYFNGMLRVRGIFGMSRALGTYTDTPCLALLYIMHLYIVVQVVCRFGQDN